MRKQRAGLKTLTHEDAVTALAALAQEHRLAIFRLLIRHGNDGLAAGAIATHLGLAPATLSFHLNQLTYAHLIESRRDGRSIIYSIAIAAVRQLLQYLSEDCCGGHPELCQISPLPQEPVDTSPPEVKNAGKRTQSWARAKKKGTH